MNAMERNFRAALPDATEAEQALLGAILKSNDTYWRVAGFLKPNHFHEKLHGDLYEVMGTMIAEGRPANPITMKPYVPAEQMVGELTLFQYMIRLLSEAITTSGAYDYARGIIEMWSRHQLIAAAHDLDALASNMPVDMTPEKIIGARPTSSPASPKEGNERAASVQYGVILPNAVTKAAKSSGDASRADPMVPA
jgi:replicative DNA helicase